MAHHTEQGPSGASLVLRLLIPRAALELNESNMVVLFVGFR